MKTTHTYLASTYFSPVYLAKLQGFRPIQDDGESAVIHMGSGGFVPGFLSGVWLWLRLCVYMVTGLGDPFEAEPFDADIEFIPKPYQASRVNRHLYQHFARRRRVAPALCLTPFHGFGSRRITHAQFLERLCRLSVWGRIRVYAMGCWAPRRVRQALIAVFMYTEFRRPSGLCRAHLWPN